MTSLPNRHLQFSVSKADLLRWPPQPTLPRLSAAGKAIHPVADTSVQSALTLPFPRPPRSLSSKPHLPNGCYSCHHPGPSCRHFSPGQPQEPPNWCFCFTFVPRSLAFTEWPEEVFNMTTQIVLLPCTWNKVRGFTLTKGPA